MSISNIFIVALKALWTNKVRSFLTMLGVIIGVGSVVLLTSIGTGLQLYVEKQFADLGSTTIFVTPGNPFGENGGFGDQEQTYITASKGILKRRHLDEIMRQHRELIKEGVASGLGVGEAKYGTVTKQITLYGVTANYAEVSKTDAIKGNWFTDTDEERGHRVVMLGNKIAEELFGQVDPVNKVLKIEGRSYRVEGVLEEKGGGFGGPSFDNYVYMPLETLFNDFNTDLIDSFTFEARSKETVAEATKSIEEIMLKYLDEDEFTVFDQKQLLQTITQILGVLTAGLGGIAAISLVVGGIGIMNIMLVSVTERTREIGLRKAVGATPNIIMIQFLMEAALLSLIGGAIGVGIAFMGSLALQSVFPAQVTIQAVILAFGVSTAVGLVFGVAPARRAAKLSPIEALRYE
jgi:putative ABC transport system permease protein